MPFVYGLSKGQTGGGDGFPRDDNEAPKFPDSSEGLREGAPKGATLEQNETSPGEAGEVAQAGATEQAQTNTKGQIAQGSAETSPQTDAPESQSAESEKATQAEKSDLSTPTSTAGLDNPTSKPPFNPQEPTSLSVDQDQAKPESSASSVLSKDATANEDTTANEPNISDSTTLTQEEKQAENLPHPEPLAPSTDTLPQEVNPQEAKNGRVASAENATSTEQSTSSGEEESNLNSSENPANNEGVASFPPPTKPDLNGVSKGDPFGKPQPMQIPAPVYPDEPKGVAGIAITPPEQEATSDAPADADSVSRPAKTEGLNRESRELLSGFEIIKSNSARAIALAVSLFVGGALPKVEASPRPRLARIAQQILMTREAYNVVLEHDLKALRGREAPEGNMKWSEYIKTFKNPEVFKENSDFMKQLATPEQFASQFSDPEKRARANMLALITQLRAIQAATGEHDEPIYITTHGIGRHKTQEVLKPGEAFSDSLQLDNFINGASEELMFNLSPESNTNKDSDNPDSAKNRQFAGNINKLLLGTYFRAVREAIERARAKGESHFSVSPNPSANTSETAPASQSQ